MSTLQDWTNRRCACIHPDPIECAKIRDKRSRMTFNEYIESRWPIHTSEDDRDFKCECVCHDLPDDDLEDLI